MLSMDELQGTPKAYVKFVQMNCDRIIDCKDAEREAIYDMLGTVAVSYTHLTLPTKA